MKAPAYVTGAFIRSIANGFSDIIAHCGNSSSNIINNADIWPIQDIPPKA